MTTIAASIIKNITSNGTITNLSSFTSQRPVLESSLFLITNIFISTCVLITNATVFALIYFNETLLTRPSYRLLLSLSFGDFCSAIFIFIHIWIQRAPAFSQRDCSYCSSVRIFTDILTTFFVESVTVHLCVIAGDKVISILRASRYTTIVTRKKINYVIALIWGIPFVTSMSQLSYLWPLLGNENVLPEKIERISHIEMWYSIISLLLYMFVPFLFIGVAFVLMFRKIRNHLLQAPSVQFCINQRASSRAMRQQRRVVYIFALMYLCFAALTLPYFTLRLILDININVALDPLIFNILYTCKILTSLCHPILYCSINRDFQSTASVIVRKTKQKLERIEMQLCDIVSNPVTIKTELLVH